jgi:hypothetical protein
MEGAQCEHIARQILPFGCQGCRADAVRSPPPTIYKQLNKNRILTFPGLA